MYSWLKYLGQKAHRYNKEDGLHSIDIEISNTQQKTTINQGADLEQVTAYWYRRGNLLPELPELSDEAVEKATDWFVDSEAKSLAEYLHVVLEEKQLLSRYAQRDVNKLTVLREAVKLGLQVPATKVCNHKATLQAFYEKHGDLITKVLDRLLCRYLLASFLYRRGHCSCD